MNIREEEEESKTGLAGLESGSKRNGANVFQTVGLHAWQIHNLPKYILNFDLHWLANVDTYLNVHKAAAAIVVLYSERRRHEAHRRAHRQKLLSDCQRVGTRNTSVDDAVCSSLILFGSAGASTAPSLCRAGE